MLLRGKGREERQEGGVGRARAPVGGWGAGSSPPVLTAVPSLLHPALGPKPDPLEQP